MFNVFKQDAQGTFPYHMLRFFLMFQLPCKWYRGLQQLVINSFPFSPLFILHSYLSYSHFFSYKKKSWNTTCRKPLSTEEWFFIHYQTNYFLTCLNFLSPGKVSPHWNNEHYWHSNKDQLMCCKAISFEFQFHFHC